MQKVFFDNRWVRETGIGVLANQIGTRLSSAGFDLTALRSDAPSVGFFAPWELLRELHRAGASHSDIFWNPGFVPLPWSKCRQVVQVHDLIHLHYHSKAHRSYYNLVFRPMYKKVDRIVTSSEYSKRELCEWAGLAPGRVEVMPLAASALFHPHGTVVDLGYRFVFYAGNYRTHKNLNRLFAAYASSTLHSQRIRLVVTGNGNKSLKSLAQELGMGEHIVFAGRLSNEDLAAYYRTSMGICFPSLYEGFGLPIIEGMASGVPVLTSNATSMPEVAGGCALLIDPMSIESISAGLDRMVTENEERAQLISSGLSHAKHFSWDRSAAQMSRILRSLGSM